MKKITNNDMKYYDHINNQYILIDTYGKRNLSFFDSLYNFIYADTTYNMEALWKRQAEPNSKNNENLFTYYQFCDPQFFEDNTAVFKWAHFANGIGESYAFFYDLKEKKLLKKISITIPNDLINQNSCKPLITYYKPKDKFYYLATLPQLEGYMLFECDGNGKIIGEIKADFVIYYPFIRFVYLDKIYFVNREYIMTLDGDNNIKKIPLNEAIPPQTYFRGFFDYDKKLIIADNAEYDKRLYTSKAPTNSFEITLDGKVESLPLKESRFKNIISYLAKKETEEIKNMPKEKKEKPPKVVTEWDKYPKINMRWVEKLFACEEKGLLYCVGERIFLVDMLSGKKIGSFKTVSNQIQIINNEEKTFFITKSTVGDFAVFNKENFQEPAWRFKLKVDNTDSDFVLAGNKLYGEATASIKDEGLFCKYFIIDIKERIITYDIKEYERILGKTPLQIEYRQQLLKTYKVKGEIRDNISQDVKNALTSNEVKAQKIPDEFKSVENATDFYENDKAKYLSTWDYLMIINKKPFGSAELALDNYETLEDSETYIRENGITKLVLDNYSEEEIIHGGYFWALDSLEAKQALAGKNLSELLSGGKITETESILFFIGDLVTQINCDGFDQYLYNTDKMDISYLINSLKLIGATKTVSVIKKAEKLHDNYKNGIYDDVTFLEKVETLCGELEGEDYIGLAVKYISTRI